MNKYDKFYNRKEKKVKLVFDELLMEFMMNMIKVNDRNYKVDGKNYSYKILNLSKYDNNVKSHIKN